MAMKKNLAIVATVVVAFWATISFALTSVAIILAEALEEEKTS